MSLWQGQWSQTTITHTQNNFVKEAISARTSYSENMSASVWGVISAKYFQQAQHEGAL